MEEKEELNEKKTIDKKEMKKTVNKLGKGLAIYITIMYLVTLGDVVIKCVKMFLNNMYSSDLEAQIEQVVNDSLLSGTSTIIGIIIGMIYLIFYFRKFDFKEKIFSKKKKMSFEAFITILIIFLSSQFVFSIVSIGIETVLNSFGYSVMGEIETATGDSQTISMLLYVGFIAPIAEEIVFRGFLLRGFQKYGKQFAIIMTAILFGASHANIVQGIYATVIGLILGYVASKYSIKWTMLLHIINNFLFAELFPYLISGASLESQSLITFRVEGFLFLGTLFIIFYNKDKIKEYIKNIKFEKHVFIYAFTSFWILLFLIPQVLQAILGVQKI